ncbi:YbaB/EbfC family nucleoid-associated protein [Thermostaphylospora chromogena]|uniref:Conserved DNA-binding protein YbaB n=1 Tax=Thermostaphylospora chromogena TaxID=35622 RepID=A0A1H1AT77_9ACTN|nr:YbaB/EbfC family nucleoid-associated protein [Thermostaphylospora chromogena]SDQ42905.1 Conserved DNA-binding protein YbaB [Thermostaphylospora chromogena]
MSTDFDVEGFMRNAEEFSRKAEEMQKKLDTIVGWAQDEDNLVTVEYTSQGLRELQIHPKAMRMSSGELAELIKEVIQEAVDDLQQRMSEVMSEVFGEEDNPMRLVQNPDLAMEKIKESEEAYNRVFNDVMGELDRIASRLKS